jgi:hypothetical protein
VQVQPRRLVPRSQDSQRVVGDRGRRRDLGHKPAVRTAEPQLAVRLSIELETLLVDRAVVSIA